MRDRIRSTMVVTGAVVAFACMRPPGSVTDRSSVDMSTVVTSLELNRAGAGQSLFIALERTRPWLHSTRGTPIRVSVDGSPPTDVSILRFIPLTHVREVRLLRASAGPAHQAVLPNGDVVVADLIVVITRN